MTRMVTVKVIMVLSTALATHGAAQSLTPENIQSIIDSVNVHRMVQTIERICGTEPCPIGDSEAFIQTRYTGTEDLHKVQQFLQDDLENYGYAVDLQQYNFANIPGKKGAHQVQYGTDFLDIQFTPDQQTGFMITDNAIYTTNDGGVSWNLTYQGRSSDRYQAIVIVNQDLCFVFGYYYRLDHRTGVAVEQGVLLRSIDSGESWEPLSVESIPYMVGLHFIDDQTGWVCNRLGTIHKTIDGGDTWIEQYRSAEESLGLTDVYFFDANTGWALGSRGVVLRTIDGGETWFDAYLDTHYYLEDMQMIDENDGFMVGMYALMITPPNVFSPYNLVLKTTDGGTSWTEVGDFRSVNSGMRRVEFIDSQKGILVGDSSVFTTRDGGTHWELADSNAIGVYTFSGDLLDANRIWICGDDMLKKSSDFGVRWTSMINNVSGIWISNNIIATKPGTTFPDSQYIFCAHYDAVSETPEIRAPGADDNGTGTAALLEAARILSRFEFPYTTKFIFFAGEEQGAIGSMIYAQSASANQENILGVINIDMIGYDNDDDGQFEIHSGGLVGSNAIGDLVETKCTEWELPLSPIRFTDNSTLQSDHASFWEKDYPAILIEEDWNDHTPFYHSTNDLPHELNQTYFHNISKLAIGSFALLADGQLHTGVGDIRSIPENFIFHSPYPNPFNPVVNLEYELRSPRHLSIGIYDMKGRKIKALVDSRRPTGRHRIAWDATTDSGAPAPSGLYIARILTQQETAQRKIILAR